MTWYGTEMKAASEAALRNLKYAAQRAEWEAQRLSKAAADAAARAAAAAAAVTSARAALAAAQAALAALEAQVMTVGGAGTMGLPAGLGAAEAAVAAAEAAVAAAVATAAEVAAAATAAMAAAAEGATAAGTAAAAVVAFLAGCALGQGIGMAGDWVVDKVWSLFSMLPTIEEPAGAVEVDVATRQVFAMVHAGLGSQTAPPLEDVRVLGLATAMGRAGNEFLRSNVRTLMHLAQFNASRHGNESLHAALRPVLRHDFQELAAATASFAHELRRTCLLEHERMTLRGLHVWQEQVRHAGKDALPAFEGPLLLTVFAYASVTAPHDLMDRMATWAGSESKPIEELALRTAGREGLPFADFLASHVHVWQSVGPELWGKQPREKGNTR